MQTQLTPSVAHLTIGKSIHITRLLQLIAVIGTHTSNVCLPFLHFALSVGVVDYVHFQKIKIKEKQIYVSPFARHCHPEI